MKIFLNGSKTVQRLPEEVTTLLNILYQQNCEFLIGDCFGADRLMQEYLYRIGCRNVTVYVSGNNVRNRVGDYPVRFIPVPDHLTGFDFYRQKDIAMIHDCDAALMLWDGKTRGTRCNIADMERLLKLYTVFTPVP